MDKEQLSQGNELSRQIAQLEENLFTYSKPTKETKRKDPKPGESLVVYTNLYANFIDMDAYRAKVSKHLTGLKKKLAAI